MAILKNLPIEGSIWESTTSVDYNQILKATGSLNYLKQEYINSFKPGTNTFTKSLNSEELKTELAKDISNDHLEPVKFNCKNLWKEENA